MDKLPVTQKAKGIVSGIRDLLYNNGCNGSGSLNTFLDHHDHSIVQSKNDIKEYTGFFPVFARPCPLKPRHGFVDSRPIMDKVELLRLWMQVKKADPDGEMVLGPYFNRVDSSAVLVSGGSLSVGKGNDGATGGNNSISFPVAPQTFKQHVYKCSGLKKNDTIYLESIYVKSRRRSLLAQVRGGPAIDCVNPDYIPKKIVVKNIVNPNNDLLKWEKEVKEFAPGTVVYAAGHTLASHAAIHCVLNKVPFITTVRPEIGDTLKPNQKKNDIKINRAQFRRGVRAGMFSCHNKMLYNPRANMQKYFVFSLSVLHNWAYIKQSEHASWLLGAASVTFLKLCTALVLGEYRHHPNNAKHKGRDQIYSTVMGNNLSSFSKLPGVFKNFYSGTWRCGFGGVPWATCAWYSYSLWKQIVSLYNRKSENVSEKELGDLVTIINKTTNIAHNNGWWFNKFTSKSEMDFVANNPGIAAFCVSDIFYEIYDKVSRVKSKSNLRYPKDVKLPCAKMSDGKLAWVYLSEPAKKTFTTLFIEDGKQKHVQLALSSKEVLSLRQKYKSIRRSEYYSMVLDTTPKGNFKIPGGKPRSIRKVFKVA